MAGRGPEAERRYPKAAYSRQPHRRSEEKTVFGTIYGLLTSKLSIVLVVVILTLKAVWPNIKAFFE